MVSSMCETEYLVCGTVEAYFCSLLLYAAFIFSFFINIFINFQHQTLKCKLTEKGNGIKLKFNFKQICNKNDPCLSFGTAIITTQSPLS